MPPPGWPVHLGVVEDDTGCVAVAGADAAHAVAHVAAIGAARARHRPVTHRKDHGVTLIERTPTSLCHFRRRPLLDQHDLRLDPSIATDD